MKKYLLVLVALLICMNASALGFNFHNGKLKVSYGSRYFLQEDTTALLVLTGAALKPSTDSRLFEDCINEDQLKILSDSLAASFNKNSPGLKLTTDSTQSYKYKMVFDIDRIRSGMSSGCFISTPVNFFNGTINVSESKTGKIELTIIMEDFKCSSSSFQSPYDTYSFKVLGRSLAKL